MHINALFLSTAVHSLYLPGIRDIRLDAMVLGFTVAISSVTGILFGLFPSLEVSRPDLADVLRESGASGVTMVPVKLIVFRPYWF